MELHVHVLFWKGLLRLVYASFLLDRFITNIRQYAEPTHDLKF